MIIYRCENPNCAKDFSQEADLKKVSLLVGDKKLDYNLCSNCCALLQAHIAKFFVVAPKPSDVKEATA